MATVNLSTPWVEHYRKVNELFKYDPEVNVIYDNDKKEVSIYVDNPQKAGAISEIINDEIDFGNVTLTINVVPSNNQKMTVPRSIYSVAFSGNPIVEDIITIDGVFTTPLTYIVFVKEVVQYFNDDLGDYYGNASTLYQIIAEDVFKSKPGICYCTSVGNA